MAPVSWTKDNSSEQRRPSFDLSTPFRVPEMSTISTASSAVQKRSYPITHSPADAPLCMECQALEMTFYDPNCQGCRAELAEKNNVSISHILAILRQWVPQVQLSIEFLVGEVLRRGAHPDDRDSVTDMTLLMYAVKSGAAGVGDVQAANNVVKTLLNLGASLEIRCRWTDMTSLHYAAFFDVGPVVTTLLMHSKGVDVDTTCGEFDNGSALHIAARNLCVESAKGLLGFGADANITDELARKPIECIPEDISGCQLSSLTTAFSTDEEAAEAVAKLKVLLATSGDGLDVYQRTFGRDETITSGFKASVSKTSVSGRTVMKALGLKIGDRVLVGGSKLGTLQFCGTTEFAMGIWAGVELDSPEGKHDGSVDGVLYFVCRPDYGIFVHPNKITKVGKHYREISSSSQSVSNYATNSSRPPMTKVNHGKVDVSKVSSRLNDTLAVIAERAEIRVGDRVSVSGLGGDKKNPTTCLGIVRYVGTVDFVDDNKKWYGIELDEPLGRHDGTVAGVRYFAANVDRGIFVTESKLTKLGRANHDQSWLAIKDASVLGFPNEHSAASSVTDHEVGKILSEKSSRPLRRSLSMQHREMNKFCDNFDMPVKDHLTPRPATQTTDSPAPSTTKSQRSNAPSTSLTGHRDWQSVGTLHVNKFQIKKAPEKKFLEPGESVICIHNKEMGVVKYVGRTDFAPGIWIGVELRNPVGKHDGIVEGRRYFTCKPKHGVMIRPSRVSVHGIVGDRLLKPESEYPF